MTRTVFLALLSLLVLATGCGARNHILFASSTVVLACDWGQTRSHAAGGWEGTQEMNPIMGTNPSPGRVDAMFATSATVNTALFAALPKRWAWVVPAVLTAAHSVAVVSNFDVAGVCGI